MHDNRSHPLLQQVPLTVSPFINLPAATTLPYTYKAMPSALPPSTTGIGVTPVDDPNQSLSASAASKPKYVISGSGHAAHPDEIIASCRALEAHLAKLQADAEAKLRALDESIHARELAEKRRVAPGWLDSDARLLEPERKSESPGWPNSAEPTRGAAEGPGQAGGAGGPSEMAVPDEGAQLDRAFGVMGLGQDERVELDKAFKGMSLGPGS